MSATPGPWLMSSPARVDNADDFAIYVTQDGKHQIIAEAFGRSDWEHAHPSASNARLIAAAPRLLAAIYEALEFAEDQSDVVDGPYGTPQANEAMQLVQTLSAAIAAATGEQP